MRKITEVVAQAFQQRYAKKMGNTTTDGNGYYLYGNKIAEWRENAGIDSLWVTSAGWKTATTRERLNGLHGVSVTQKDFEWYLNGKKWDGQWVRISDWLPKN